MVVLSIGKLAVGQARYYLDQAHRRVDRATSVASGVEDYYLDGTEAAGEWLGRGSLALGLSGTVEDAPLQAVLAGESPRSGELLRATRGTRVPGFDLTFSAPKSASVLFGIADSSVRGAIQESHDVAVRDAIGYVERMVGVARRGHGGEELIAGVGLVAAAFRHRTSRAGDPQLHTHVLVANLIEGADGRWSALDGRRIYAHAKTASYLYEARLRAELTWRLGIGWTPVRKGLAEIVGVPRPVLRAFSRRRVEIEAELARIGEHSAGAAQVAALTTRRAKERLVDPRSLTPEWRARAAALGFDDEQLRSVLHRHRAPELTAADLSNIADELAGPEGLTECASSFGRREVIRGWCERLPGGTPVCSERVEELADAFIASARAVALLGSARPPADVLRVRGRARVPLLRDELRYSTPELLAIERAIVETALEGVDLPNGIADPAAVAAALARRPFLSDEQQSMVRRLTGDGGQVVAVIGKAGTGKTTALAGAHEAWSASGIRVVGAAVARRAAHELQEAAGIPSTSLAGLLVQLRRGGDYGLAPGTVVVLDEASMAASRDLGELVEHVREANGKLVLCGDHRQLPSIRAGGAFRALAARTDPIELSDNRRQTQQWEREALDQLRDGTPIDAIRVYEANERLVVGGDKSRLMQRLVDDWWRSRHVGTAAMIALRRADVRELNATARARMRAAGELSPDVELECGTFASGDRVVLRRNNRRLGIANGELATVRRVDSTGLMTVQIAGRRVQLPAWYLEPSKGRPAVQHAYAITGHIAQGMTVDFAFVLGCPEIYREWGYTAMSRGRHRNRLYVVARDDPERREIAPRENQPPSAEESLIRGLAASRAQTATLDAAHAQTIRSAPSRELQRRAERLRASDKNARLAAAVADYDNLAMRVDGLRAAVSATEQQLASLRQGRPTRIRLRARRSHDQQERRLIDDLRRRRASLEATAMMLDRAAQEVEAGRAVQARPSNPAASELELIEDELARRATLEHAAGLSARVERPAIRR